MVPLQIFGHIFKDSDKHFNLFRKKGETQVNPKQVLCVLGLLSIDSPSSKLLFFHELYFVESEETIEASAVPFLNVTVSVTLDYYSQACLLKWFRHTLAGAYSIFNLQQSCRDIAQDAVESCLRNFKAAQMAAEADHGESKTTGGSLEVLDILQLIQESHTVSKFTDAVLSLCSPAQVVFLLWGSLLSVG